MAQSDLMPTSISLGSTSVAAGGSLPAAPTPTEYFDASYAAYAQNTSSAPSGMTLLFSSDSSELSDGFFAQAFEDSNGNVIIAFEGTVQDNTAYGKATQAADAGILGGNLLLQPTAPTQILQDAYAFAFSVVATDALTGISGATYVTGHSLGGYEAEYVAQQLPSSISGGATFGAPGLLDYAGTTTEIFKDYVETADPIGNYATDASSALNTLGQGHIGFHFGQVVPVSTNVSFQATDTATLQSLNKTSYYDQLANLAKNKLFGTDDPFVDLWTVWHPLKPAYQLALDTTLTEPKSTLPVSTGGTATISHSFLWSYDIDNTTGAYGSPADVTYTVTAPIHGTLLLNGTTTSTFTQADIDTGLVKYRENGDVATNDGFTFTVSDLAGNHITEDFRIAILNTTAPVTDANTTLSASIGRSTMIWTDALSTVALDSTPDQMTYSVLTAPAHGVLLINGAAANWFTQAEIDDHLVQYRASGDGATSDGFTFQATDAAGDQTPVTALNIVIADGAQGPDTTGQTPPRNDGMLTANLALLGQYAAAGFATAPDQGGSTLVAYTAAQGGGDPNLLAIPHH